MNAYTNANQNYASAVSIPAVAAMMAGLPANFDDENREAVAVEIADKIERRKPDHAEPSSALIEREALKRAVDMVKHVVDKRSIIPVLANARIVANGTNSVIVTGTDMDCEIHVTVPAATDFDFGVTLPAHVIESVLKKATPGDFVAIKTPRGVWQTKDNGEPLANPTYEVEEPARVELERSTYNLKCAPTSEFPDITPVEATNVFVMRGDEFRAMLERTRGAVSTEETRYYLNGVFFHTYQTGNMLALRAIATDGHRLYMQEIEAPHGVTEGLGIKSGYQPGAILPRSTVDLLLKLLKGKACPENVKIAVSEIGFEISFGDIRLVSKLIDGTFPDYQRVIPTSNHNVSSFMASEMLAAIADVTVIASGKSPRVKLSLSDGECVLSYADPETGNARSATKCTFRADGGSADDIEIGYVASQFSEMIQVAAPNGGEIIGAIGDAGSPAVFRGEHEGWLAVLMPTRI